MSFNIFDQFVFSLFTRLLEMSAKLQLNKQNKKTHVILWLHSLSQITLMFIKAVWNQLNRLNAVHGDRFTLLLALQIVINKAAEPQRRYKTC